MQRADLGRVDQPVAGPQRPLDCLLGVRPQASRAKSHQGHLYAIVQGDLQAAPGNGIPPSLGKP